MTQYYSNIFKSSIALLLFIVSFSSCKKGEQVCQIGNATISDGVTYPGANVFSFYEDGRLKKIVYNTGTRDSVSYSADSIYITTNDYQDTLVSFYAGVLNSAGNVVSAVVTHNPGSVTASTETLSFEYNSDGQMTKQTRVSGGIAHVLNLTYQNGSKVSATEYSDTSLSATYYFAQYETENKAGFDEGVSVFAPYYGKGSNHLLHTSLKIVNTDTTEFEYDHDLDGNGYLIKTRETQLRSFTSSLYYAYGYTCKDK